MKKWKRLCAWGLAVVMSLSLLSGCGKNARNGEEILPVCVGETPVTYDPIYAEELGDQTILVHLYENLMRVSLDSEGGLAVTEGAAKSVTVEENADGTVTYTFHLRDAKWSDGVQVRASDFVYAWQRLASPASNSPYASLLSIVSGYREARTSGDMSKMAVTAKNNTTLVVTLNGYYDWFLREVCTSPVTSPLREDVVKKLKEAAEARDPDGSGGERWWSDPTQLVTNGPFMVAERDGYRTLTLSANRHYDRKRSGPEKLEFHFGDAETAKTLYETNGVDVIWPLTESWMASLQETDSTWKADPELITHAVLFNYERLTDDDVMTLLKLIFHRQDTQELLKKLLEREKPETP